jgi:hypothetical protein
VTVALKYRIKYLPSGPFRLEMAASLDSDNWVVLGDFLTLEQAEQGIERAVAQSTWYYDEDGQEIKDAR